MRITQPNATCTVRRAAFTVPATPESVGIARKKTAALIDEWKLPVDTDTAVLLLSEIVTNAILHGITPTRQQPTHISVGLLETPTGLHVEVHDPNDGKPNHVTVNHPAAQAESGRGLELVDVLSTAWGCTYTPEGKFVYFDLETEADERDHTTGIGEAMPCT